MIREAHESRARELSQLIPSILSVVPPEQSGVTLEDLASLYRGLNAIDNQFQVALQPFGGDPAIPEPENVPSSLPQEDLQTAQSLPFLIGEIYLDVQRAREVVAQRALQAMQSDDLYRLSQYIGQFNALEDTMQDARSAFNSLAARKSLQLIQSQLPAERLSEQSTGIRVRQAEEGPAAKDLLMEIIRKLDQQQAPTESGTQEETFTLKWFNDLEGLEQKYSLEAMAQEEVLPYKIAGRMLHDARVRILTPSGDLATQGNIANPEVPDGLETFSVSYMSAVERGMIVPSMESLSVILTRLKIPFDSAFCQVLLRKTLEGAYYLALHPELKRTDVLSPDEVVVAASKLSLELSRRSASLMTDNSTALSLPPQDSKTQRASDEQALLIAGFGSLIRSYRKTQPHLSQLKLARQIGVSHSLISQIELGNRPSQEVFEKLINALGIKTSEANTLRQAFGFPNPKDFTQMGE